MSICWRPIISGDKFTKFEDGYPGREDAETTKRIEREGILGAETFSVTVSDLKADVFGPVAIATFVCDFEVTMNADAKMAGKARWTMVFVKRGDNWLITHEHSSALQANP